MGATAKPQRYAGMAIQSLVNHKHSVIAFGRETGEVAGVKFENDWNPNWNADTVTLYLSPKNQETYIDKIIQLNPKRVIFNPGTENPEFFKKLRDAKIEVEVACTLVMLATDQY